jgi:hypothetical protein
MKTQGEKIKTRAKIKTEGGKMSYIFPQLKYSAQILSQKKMVFSGKNMIINIAYIFPLLDFCALFSMTTKIVGEKI